MFRSEQQINYRRV